MNVFVLNTGRCASTTWIKACQHINNFSAGHETRAHLVGVERLAYAKQHIEADNRLSWVLGRLNETFGDRAFYVHLGRERAATVRSFEKRSEFGIMKAYREGVLLDLQKDTSVAAIAADYIETVESNIRFFLQDKPLQMKAQLATIKEDFEQFWQQIGAEGDLNVALAEFDVRYNQSTDLSD